ncbi:hypothetical protein NCCP1664_04680 [Zafaria cholistanensis]|uniref:Uncharacterized protein n=1 Tax=Zafaria cholistanensis TaxID=1682741 RepID=A0A5A7NQA3_9MICC|nr:hypothetical protein [Zafaria cholistanensis]GER21971.1 hypothetical protein NCCP1664_04680 [Zafaria cholistanensis]
MTPHFPRPRAASGAPERRFRITGTAYQWLVYNDPETSRRFRNATLALLAVGAVCAGLLLPELPLVVERILLAGAAVALLSVLISVGTALMSAFTARPDGLLQVAAAAGTDLEGLAVAVRAAERRRIPTVLPSGFHLRTEHTKGKTPEVAIVMVRPAA